MNQYQVKFVGGEDIFIDRETFDEIFRTIDRGYPFVYGEDLDTLININNICYISTIDAKYEPTRFITKPPKIEPTPEPEPEPEPEPTPEPEPAPPPPPPAPSLASLALPDEEQPTP